MGRASRNNAFQSGALFSGEVSDQLDGLNKPLPLATIQS